MRALGANSTAKAVAIAAYGLCGALDRAADAAGIGFSTLMLWRRQDAEFDQGIRLAKEQAAERVVGTLFDRFVHGWVEVRIDRYGNEHRTHRYLGERAAQLLLAAWRPTEFGNRLEVEQRPRDPEAEKVFLERFADPAVLDAVIAIIDGEP